MRRREFITHGKIRPRGSENEADIFFVAGCIALALLVSGGSAQTEMGTLYLGR
jgi:hypothetical protein